MSFDFDTPIARLGTHSVKWDMMDKKFGPAASDAIPMWVADMDFEAPPAVNQALRDRADHGVHGYFGGLDAFYSAFLAFMERRHGWKGQMEWLTTTHGLVNAIGFCTQAYAEVGENVLMFSPVYHQFAGTVRANGRIALESPLRLVQGRYEMDFDDMAQRVNDKTKMVLLCSPHNPGGRVWSKEELKQLAEFCVEKDLVLVSDEIHSDLVFEGATHTVTLDAAPEAADHIVTLLAPTKTFNIAGAMTGLVAIPNAELRERFMQRKMAAGQLAVNGLGVLASTAAYQHGDAWLDALIPYLQGNRDRIDTFVSAEIPGARSMPLEATYLSWIDFSGTGLSTKEVEMRIKESARIVVNPGATFGPGGDSFMRFNFACPRVTLDRALERLVTAFS